MNDERGTYRERTWAPAWVRVVISGACLLGLGASFYEAFQHTAQGAAAIGDDSLSLLGSALVGGGFLLFYVTMTSIFMCLDVEVRADHLFISFGPVRLVRKRIQFADIESAKAVTYSPIREFGGWGIRGWGRRTAWTIRGNQAVRVKLVSGKEVYVGSRFPQRLAGRIEVAMRGAKHAWRARPGKHRDGLVSCHT